MGQVKKLTGRSWSLYSDEKLQLDVPKKSTSQVEKIALLD
jgi:hypothetical protein